MVNGTMVVLPLASEHRRGQFEAGAIRRAEVFMIALAGVKAFQERVQAVSQELQAIAIRVHGYRLTIGTRGDA
jgi:hypothetical protein